ncbi:class IV lanthionine synthetase LanL [Streptomyces sp. NPDC037389]|uniref:class IV lanthionine synthetase LanL n=1 Tax=Streptomyces sp. NPDC037389 TaxID=3155369 RepID=UPI0033EB33D3
MAHTTTGTGEPTTGIPTTLPPAHPGDAPKTAGRGETALQDRVRSVLAAHRLDDWHVSPGDFWCSVAPPGGTTRVQGWKLHLSATPVSAATVLARAAEVLARHRCAYKFAATPARVAELCSRAADRAGGGKFLTVYPEDDGPRLRALAAELHDATQGLAGPGILSDRPYRPGSLVHYRYGAHRGVTVLADDATRTAMLRAPDGSLRRDRRTAWFAPPDWAPRDPFTFTFAEPEEGTGAGGTAAPRPVLLDGRYVVEEVIRHAFTGGVYRATDQHTGATVVVKQARPHTDATLTGRDIRDARRHEAAMLEEFAAGGLTPRPVALFEQQGDLFLVLEDLPGVTLRRWVADRLTTGDDHWGLPHDLAVRLALHLVDLVAYVHGRGYVLRDLNPANLLVTEDDELRLIDLELLVRHRERITRAHTPGYAAPEQRAAQPGATGSFASDRYSLGATLFHLVTGAEPLLAPDEPPVRTEHQRLGERLGHLGRDNPTARRLAPLVLALLRTDPARRPGLVDVRRALTGRGTPATVPAPRPDPAPPTELTDGCLAHLLATMDPGRTDRLWPPSPYGATSDAFNVQHGAAGVLGVLARACRAGSGPAVREATATAAAWITRHVGREPRVLPGLYFGRSGTAWALLDAGEALGDRALTDAAAALVRRVPLAWPNPDVCHGTAGAGLTQLRFWEATGARDFLDRAHAAATALAPAATRRAGRLLWPVPPGCLSDPAEVVHYGFAHGTAGVGTFLLAVGLATRNGDHLALAAEAARTLLAAADVADGAAYWPAGPSGGPRRTTWCSGSSGIGTFLLRMWGASGDSAFLDGAVRAAVAVHRSRRHAGTAQCHGLAGDGEFLLDLAEACGEQRYRDWAEDLAGALHARRTLRAGRVLAPDETGTSVHADYGTGLAGVLAFLLRLRDGGPRLWLPRTLTGPGTTAGRAPTASLVKEVT